MVIVTAALFHLASALQWVNTKALAVLEPPPIDGLPGGQFSQGQIRQTILNIIIAVLNFIALIAVVFIIIAGIRLIVSQGSDDQKEKAKKSILYVAIGLVVIILARVIVGFVASLATQVGTGGAINF